MNVPGRRRRIVLTIVVLAVGSGAAVAIPVAITRLAGDEADRRPEDAGRAGGPTGASARRSLYSSETLAKAVAAVEEKEGGDAELVAVNVLVSEADFYVKKDGRLRRYAYFGQSGKLTDADVQAGSSGTPEAGQFALSKVDPDAVAKIASATRRKDVEEIASMSLHRSAARASLQWFVVGTIGVDRVRYVGNRDGTRLRRVRRAESTGGESGGGPPGRAPGARGGGKLADCLEKAGGDLAKIQACDK